MRIDGTGQPRAGVPAKTMGESLRVRSGVLAHSVEHPAQWARLKLTQASVTPSPQANTPEEVRLVTLYSDRVSDQVDHKTLLELCAAHTDEPQVFANALVAAFAGDDGYHDDTTVARAVWTGRRRSCRPAGGRRP
ncbi:hypothetical protein [Streptomyces eurythermus]